MTNKIDSYKNLIEYLEINFETFTNTQKYLTNYLIANINDVAFLTADEIAEKVNTTPSSVVRFAKQIGYHGYPELQKDLQNLSSSSQFLEEPEYQKTGNKDFFLFHLLHQVILA